MRSYALTLSSIAFLVITALRCHQGLHETKHGEKIPSHETRSAEKIYYNGVFWTGTKNAEVAQAMAIAEGKILAVGTRDEVFLWRGSQTQLVDLGGHLVLPGLIDAHTHFLMGGFRLGEIDLSQVNSPQAFANTLEAYIAKKPDGQWITGGNWDHERWGGTLPRRDWIDKVSLHHPVIVRRHDGHMALANSVAMARAGITAQTKNPEGGTIVRDEKTGEPTGIFKDNAMELFEKVIPKPTDDDRDQALKQAMTHALARGVTQVHDMGSWEGLSTYQRAHRKHQLQLRVYAFVPLDERQRLAEFVAKHGRGDDWLHWGGVKGFMDGSLGSSTALFYQPYVSDPQNHGLLVTDVASMQKAIEEADANGLQCAVHAIGNRANDLILDVFAEVAMKHGERDRRFRVEHAQHLRKQTVTRFAKEEIIPSMQPYHAIDDGCWAHKRLGSERLREMYVFRSLLDSHARVCFGSDWTVAPIDPLLGIYAAVTRRTLDNKHPEGWFPDQKISVAEAVRAYTVGGAYAGYQEDQVGTLEPGKLADFVELSQNIFDIDPVKIPEVKVLRTVVGGEVRFSAQ